MTISIDEKLKNDFTSVCKELGLTPSTAIGLFARAVVREHGIPFAVTSRSPRERMTAQYYQTIMDGISLGMAQFEAGEYISREESQKLHAEQAGAA